MTYEQWDAVADSINPIMALLVIALPFLLRPDRENRRLGFFAATGIGMAIMYALGWLDQRLLIWSAMGLDYSTHTGFAIVLIVSIWHWNRRAGALGTAVGMAYAVLMLYQRYHTAADVLSTAVVITAFTWIVHGARRAIATAAGDRRDG